MEVFTCIFLATAFCGQLEPFAGLNYAATVKSVEVWEQEVCKQHFPGYHFGVQGDYSCHCPGFLEIQMKAAAHLGGPQKDVQVPQVCWKYRNRSYAVSEVSNKNTHVFCLKRKTKLKYWWSLKQVLRNQKIVQTIPQKTLFMQNQVWLHLLDKEFQTQNTSTKPNKWLSTSCW